MKQSEIIKIYYAGAPEYGVGDIIIKNVDERKIKLPVQLANEFGVQTQLVELCPSEDSYRKSKGDLFILDVDGIKIYKRNSKSNKNFVLIASPEVIVDKTIPMWIWA